MGEISASLELADILRKRIDECAKWKRNVETPPEDLLERWAKFSGDEESKSDELSEQELKLCHDWFFSVMLEHFLDAKEKLVIPDDALGRLSGTAIRIFEDDVGLRFAYQDFYAYKFCDMLDDIVSRACSIHDVFVKRSVSTDVERACAEAYCCFLYGCNTAAVALCRAILEADLKLALKKDAGDLGKLNEEAKRENVISPEIFRKINFVNRAANRYLHEVSRGKKAVEKETLEIIGLTQEILQALPPPDSPQGGPK